MITDIKINDLMSAFNSKTSNSNSPSQKITAENLAGNTKQNNGVLFIKN